MTQRDSKAFIAAKNRLAANQPRQPDPYRTRSVAAVHEDGSVDLDWGFDEDGNSVVVGPIPCEAHIAALSVGDAVRVIVTDDIIRSITAKL